MRGTLSCVAMAGAFVSLVAFTAQELEARGGGRGGGARGGGASSMSRGGGGGGGGGRSFSGGGGGGSKSFGGGSMSRGGNYSRPSGASAGQRPSTRPGQGGSGTANRGNINTGNVNRGNINTGNINTGNINTGNINRGNINTGNVNIDRDVNIDVDNDWNGWGGYYDHPVARGVAIGTAAAVTAAVIGSRYYALPAGCSPYPYSSLTYYSCGSVWYQPSYQGDTVVYVVVNKPG